MEKFTEDFKYSNGHLYNVLGKQLGWYDKSSGYFKARIKSKPYLLHRLIFFYHYGYFPLYIDHIDRNKLNNKIENLRECKQKCFNTVNTDLRVDNTSGYKGVSKHRSGKWQSSVYKDGKKYNLGLFTDPIEAAKIYDKKAKELFGDFVKLNFNDKEII